MFTVLRLALAVGIIGISGCASHQAPPCSSGTLSARVHTLYFGTKTPSGVVDQEAWASFVASVARPRFPEGLTVWSASGQWQETSGAISTEASYVLQVVVPEANDSESRLIRVIGDRMSVDNGKQKI